MPPPSGSEAPELTREAARVPVPQPIASIDDVIEFWFGTPARDEAELNQKLRRWLTGDDAFDYECGLRFGATIDAALRADLRDWARTARGRLALVVVLDQLARNVLRGRPRMYAGDPRAQQLALHAFSDGTARQLGPIEQLFLAMPLFHAEDTRSQQRFLEIVREISSQAPPLYKRVCVMYLEQSGKLCQVLARYRRYPHRNLILGRPSTPSEIEFLKTWWQMAPPVGLGI